MMTIDFTNFEDNMNSYMDWVIDEHEPVRVTRKNNRNVVIISQENYNNLMENAHIFESKANFGDKG